MSNTRVQLHFDQFLALRRDRKTQDAITSSARGLADKANQLKRFKDAHYNVLSARDSAKGSIALVTTSGDSGHITRLEERVNHTLLKAISGGGQ